MLVSEREKKADKINRTARTVSSTYSGNSSKGKRLYAKRKGESKIQVTRGAHRRAPASPAEQWLSGRYKVLQQEHVPRFFHFAPSLGDCDPPARPGGSALAAFAASVATSVTTQSVWGSPPSAICDGIAWSHISPSHEAPGQNLRRASRDCPNFTQCASGIMRVLGPIP